MNFTPYIHDPTDTNPEPIAVHGTIYGWVVNRDSENVLLFVRCWRSEAARAAGKQPLLDTQLAFSSQDQGHELIERMLVADWARVASIASQKLLTA